jgi:hypothetical protein
MGKLGIAKAGAPHDEDKKIRPNEHWFELNNYKIK